MTTAICRIGVLGENGQIPIHENNFIKEICGGLEKRTKKNQTLEPIDANHPVSRMGERIGDLLK